MDRPTAKHAYGCPCCDAPLLTTYPTFNGRLGVAFTSEGLHLSLWTPGQDGREMTLEPYRALEMARAILREFGGRGE